MSVLEKRTQQLIKETFFGICFFTFQLSNGLLGNRTHEFNLIVLGVDGGENSAIFPRATITTIVMISQDISIMRPECLSHHAGVG